MTTDLRQAYYLNPNLAAEPRQSGAFKPTRPSPKGSLMKRVWLAEVECYTVGSERGSLIQVESKDKNHAVETLQRLMDTTGKVVGENCYGPTVREHISVQTECA